MTLPYNLESLSLAPIMGTTLHLKLKSQNQFRIRDNFIEHHNLKHPYYYIEVCATYMLVLPLVALIITYY